MVPYGHDLAAGYVRFPIPDASVIDDVGYDRILTHRLKCCGAVLSGRTRDHD